MVHFDSKKGVYLQNFVWYVRYPVTTYRMVLVCDLLQDVTIASCHVLNRTELVLSPNAQILPVPFSIYLVYCCLFQERVRILQQCRQWRALQRLLQGMGLFSKKNYELFKISVFKNGSSSHSYLHAVLKDPGSSAFLTPGPVIIRIVADPGSSAFFLSLDG